MMRMGRFRVSYALLEQWLCLPVGAEIVTVEKGEQPYSFDVYIEHWDLPIVPEGQSVPKGDIIFKSNPPVEFVEWKMHE